MFEFCFSFVIYLRWFLCLRCWRWCHWSPSLDIALYQPMLSDNHYICTSSSSSMQCFSLFPQQSGTLCTTLIVCLSSVIACLTHPQKWESCITYIYPVYKLLSKSIAECDNVLFIHCKLPIKVLPSICSAFGMKYSVNQFSVFWNTLTYTSGGWG